MEDDLPNKKKGRTRVADVSREQVWKLATIGCTLQEIAYMTGVSRESLKKNFGDLIEVGYQTGKRSLRKKQMERAMEGSDRMLIWLGKQMLNQKEITQDSDDDMPLPWQDD